MLTLPPAKKVINPAFRRAMPVQTFGSLMPKVFACIDKEQEVVVIKLMQRLTLDALGTAAFGKCDCSCFFG